MAEKAAELAKLQKIQAEGLATLEVVAEKEELEAWRVSNLGRSSPVMGVFSSMGTMDKELRPLMGKAANEVRTALETAFEAKREVIEAAALAKELETESLDVTMPGRCGTRPPAPVDPGAAADRANLWRYGLSGLSLH